MNGSVQMEMANEDDRQPRARLSPELSEFLHMLEAIEDRYSSLDAEAA